MWQACVAISTQPCGAKRIIFNAQYYQRVANGVTNMLAMLAAQRSPLMTIFLRARGSRWPIVSSSSQPA